MSIRIKRLQKIQKNFDRVTVNFIYNRFDLHKNCPNYEIVSIDNSNDNRNTFIEYSIKDDVIELGIWQVYLTKEEIKKLLFYISKKHKNVNIVKYRNSFITYGKYRRHNHFKIIFPDNVEELENRLSHHSLVNLRKRYNKAENELGNISFKVYSYNEIPQEIVNTFFEYKDEIYQRQYDMSAKEYLDKYHVSHCHVLYVGKEIGAIRFACEQCPIVNGENFSYNPKYKKYSLGRIIYHYHLKKMVEKKHPMMYLSGGKWEYKTHYGSIEEKVYDGTIDIKKENFDKYRLMYRIKRKLKHILKRIQRQ